MSNDKDIAKLPNVWHVHLIYTELQNLFNVCRAPAVSAPFVMETQAEFPSRKGNELQIEVFICQC